MKLRLSSTILHFLTLFIVSVPLFVSCLPSNLCKYTNDLLYGSTIESTSFSGEIFPVANDPPPIYLFQYLSETLIRCYISGTETSSSGSDTRVLSGNDEYYLCVFGCVRVLYRITIYSGNKSNVFYSLIVSDREKTTCPRTDGLKTVTKAESMKHSFPPQSHDLSLLSKSGDILLKEQSVVSSHIVTGRIQRNPNLIRNCVPTEMYSSPSALLNKPKSWSQFWQSALLPNTTKALCNGIYKNLLERHKLASGMRTTISDYTEMVKYMFLLNNQHKKTPLFPKVTEICYIHPDSKTVHVVSSIFTNSLCRFGCLKQYLKYELTGDTVLFIHSLYCRNVVFYPCSEDTRLNPDIVKTRFKITKNSDRKPVPVVFHVTDPSGDRRKVVRMAIKRLRRSPGFGSLQRSEIKTKVVKKGKHRYRVFLWFDLFLLEH